VAATIVDALGGLNIRYPTISAEQSREIAQATRGLDGAAGRSDASAA
jgi:hypothetical protein